MLRSMTGFGTGRAADERRSFAVEIRSVNHKFCEMRAREGASLESELARLLAEVRAAVASIAKELPAAADQRKARLDQRLKEIIGDQSIDPLRMAQEAALLADRADVTEELARFES